MQYPPFIKSTLNMIAGSFNFVKATLTDALRIIRSPKENLKQIYGVSFFRNAVYLVANSGVTLLLGFVFYIVITRFYSVSDVGLGSALLSAWALLSFLGTLGFGYSTVRYLPVSNNKSRLLNFFFTISGLASIVACLIFLGGLSWWSPKLTFICEDPLFFIMFVIFVTATTLNTIATQAFVASRRSGFTLSQGIISSMLRLSLAIVLASVFGVFGIVASQGIAVILSLAVCLLLFLSRVLPGYRPFPAIRANEPGGSRELVSYSLANYASEGLFSLPSWILPLIILNISGAEDSAYFYMAWTMSTVLLAIGIGISSSLFAEGSYEAKNISRNLVSSLKLIILLLIPAIVVLVLLGDKFLLAYGKVYSTQGTRLLQLLAVAALPASVNLIYLSLVRIEKQLKSLLLVSGVMAVGTVVLSCILLSRLGIMGAGISWLAIQTALLLITLPAIVRKIKNPSMQ
jgi:O-antigen/teichoic acid export membrane protein